MAQSSQLPKFGNWENEENVSYTAFFDNPRKKKGSRRMTPSPHDDNTPIRPPPLKQEDEPKGLMGTKPIRPTHERQKSPEDGQIRRLTDFSPLDHDSVGQTPVVDLSRQRYNGGVTSSRNKVESEAPRSSDMLRPGMCEAPKRVLRKSGGYDRSIDQSSLHAHYKARVGGGKMDGVSYPSWEKKGSSEASHGLAPSTLGRSRLRSVARGDDNQPDHGPVVPKFGDWDESNPASAEGYTHMFEKVRKEKQIGAGKVPAMATESPYSNGQSQYRNANPKSCCCFPWGGK
ncbi:RPM1-interacting protein 4-like isoform X3 [Rhododendron vialii]|uniref:RPM1-interacting protein 4-like isoform X3 n=1 Tax=Rhododendron vialii TaxID=182163 RepID=UPI00265ED65C|nr:RPM1-interacting protein 4-like isoform X3 [Rhododendron vialii]